MSNYKKYLIYKNKYLDLKNQIGGLSFCQKAYKNVHGTCWAVAIQTMFTFGQATSNDLKTVMESIYLDSQELSFDEIKGKKKKFIDERIHSVQYNRLLNSFYRLLNDSHPEFFYIGYKREYLKNILNKFIDRYYSKVLEINNTRKPEDIDDENNTERCELVIAQNFKKVFDYQLLNYLNLNKMGEYAGNIISEYLFFNLLSVFFLDYKVSFKLYYDFRSIKFDPINDLGILIRVQNHMCCLYICDGEQKYYDDNNKQVFKCNWIEILQKSENLYIEVNENLRFIDYSSYENKHNLIKIKDLILVSKHTIDSDLDLEIKKILNFSKFNLSDFKSREIQYIIGNMFYNNSYNGVARNWAEAVQWYRHAAEQGDSNSMRMLGWILSEGKDGVPQDKEEAIHWYQIASEKGDKIASFLLADMFEKKTMQFYHLAAEQGDIESQFKLAKLLLNDQKIEEAKKWFKIAAEKGNVDAQYYLGDKYYKGDIFEKNDSEADVWYRRAAKQGHIEAQFKLGDYYNSFTKNQDALQWYQSAADKGHAGAQFKLGEMYDSGKVAEIQQTQSYDFDFDIFTYRSVERQKILHKLKAVELYTLAAKQGHVEAQKKIDIINYNKELDLANKGNPDSQNNVGIMLWKGKGVAKNYNEAIKFFRYAVDQGNSDASNNLGMMFWSDADDEGGQRQRDNKEALKFFRIAVAKNHPDAYSNLGDMYEGGEGVDEDKCEAERLNLLAVKYGNLEAQKNLDRLLFKKEHILANQGNAEAQYKLASMYYDGTGVWRGPNLEEAARWFKLAAENGLPKAQNKLGDLYSNVVEMTGVAHDDKEAVRWYKLAVAKGHPEAHVNLGTMYEDGRGGVNKDYCEAERLYHLAVKYGNRKAQKNLDNLLFKKEHILANQGNAEAQYKLASMYYSGEGVTQNPEEAVRWCKLAAEQGLPIAQNKLGDLYSNVVTIGVAHDDKEAVRWYRLAVEQGYADAQFNLGYMFENGLGVAHDDKEADRLYILAAKQGHYHAIRHSRRLRHMSTLINS